MMNKLTKEECLEALETLCTFADGNPSSSGEFVGKMLQEADDKLKQLINEHFDNPPLKFEELHEKMWVWDNKYHEYCFIDFIAGKYPHRSYINNCQSDGAFEENRFYSYEVKE